MSDDEQGGYRIGFRELYTLVNQVSAKLDAIADKQSQQIGNNTARIETLEKALKVMWGRIDAKASNAWQVNLAIASSITAVLIAVAQMLTK